MAKTRFTKNAGYIDRRATKMNGPPDGAPWTWLTRELMESSAFRNLSGSGLKALFRIMIEHMNHGGAENGRLKVTWNDFVKYGISRAQIASALKELVASGFIRVTDPGRKAYGLYKGTPAQYASQWLPITSPNDLIPPTNAWKRHG